MNTAHTSTIENRIANDIRWAIQDFEQGRSGKTVYGQGTNTVQHRIYQVRVRKGVLYGRALDSGKWFALAGWEAR